MTENYDSSLDSYSIDQETKAIIPVPSRALSVGRWLPALKPGRVAAGVVAGAVSSIFFKRLVELTAEDLYQRAKGLLDTAQQHTPMGQTIEEIPINTNPSFEPREESRPRLDDSGTVVFSYTRIERVTMPLRSFNTRRRRRFRHQVEIPLVEPGEPAE